MGCDCRVRRGLLSKTYTLQKGDVYFDHAAASQVTPEVIGVYERALRSLWANPSSQHGAGVLVYKALDDVCTTLSRLFSRGRRWYFGESSSRLMHLFMQYCSVDSLIVPVTGHRSFQQAGQKVHTVGVLPTGEIDLVLLEELLSRTTSALLLYAPVHHETGVVQPVRKIYALAQKYDCLICLDAVQTVTRLGHHEWEPYGHAFFCSSYKVGAPPGAALLGVDPTLAFSPPLHDASLEWSLFSGSVNAPAVCAFAKALSLHMSQEERVLQELGTLTREARSILSDLGPCMVFETPKKCITGILCITLPDIDDVEDLLLFLSSRRIYLSRFSACDWDLSKPSRVLTAMGVPPERAKKSLRLSLSRNNQRSDFFILKKALREAFSQGL